MTGDLRDWSVSIDQTGRGGSITYREGSNELVFDWEFGGGDAIALLFGPTRERWDSRVPWARGRQAEVLARIADEVVRQKAPGCHVEFDEDLGSAAVKRGPPR